MLKTRSLTRLHYLVICLALGVVSVVLSGRYLGSLGSSDTATAATAVTGQQGEFLAKGSTMDREISLQSNLRRRVTDSKKYGEEEEKEEEEVAHYHAASDYSGGDSDTQDFVPPPLPPFKVLFITTSRPSDFAQRSALRTTWRNPSLLRKASQFSSALRAHYQQQQQNSSTQPADTSLWEDILSTFTTSSTSSSSSSSTQRRPANPTSTSSSSLSSLFFVGRSAFDAHVSREAAQEGDVILLDVEDGWPNVPLKYMSALSWCVEHGGAFDYLVRTDMDTLLNPFVLVEWLQELAPRRGLWAGAQMGSMPVYRAEDGVSSRYRVNRSAYNESRYPDYLSGYMQVMSRDVVERFVSAAPVVPLIPNIDDGYMGIVARAAGVTPVEFFRSRVASDSETLGTDDCRSTSSADNNRFPLAPAIAAVTQYGKDASHLLGQLESVGCPLEWYPVARALQETERRKPRWQPAPFHLLPDDQLTPAFGYPNNSTSSSSSLEETGRTGRESSDTVAAASPPPPDRGAPCAETSALYRSPSIPTSTLTDVSYRDALANVSTLFDGKPPLWVYYEENADGKASTEEETLKASGSDDWRFIRTPPIARMLLDRIREMNEVHFTVIVVNASTMHQYLPLPPPPPPPSAPSGDDGDLVLVGQNSTAVEVETVLPSLFPDHRVDYYRVRILEAHGGIFVDARRVLATGSFISLLEALLPMHFRRYSAHEAAAQLNSSSSRSSPSSSQPSQPEEEEEEVRTQGGAEFVDVVTFSRHNAEEDAVAFAVDTFDLRKGIVGPFRKGSAVLAAWRAHQEDLLRKMGPALEQFREDEHELQKWIEIDRRNVRPSTVGAPTSPPQPKSPQYPLCLDAMCVIPQMVEWWKRSTATADRSDSEADSSSTTSTVASSSSPSSLSANGTAAAHTPIAFNYRQHPTINSSMWNVESHYYLKRLDNNADDVELPPGLKLVMHHQQQQNTSQVAAVEVIQNPILFLLPDVVTKTFEHLMRWEILESKTPLTAILRTSTKCRLL